MRCYLASPFFNDVEIKRMEMIKDLLAKSSPKTIEQATEVVYGRVNETCRAILGNTAVFKANEVGEKGFKAFLNGLNIFEI